MGEFFYDLKAGWYGQRKYILTELNENGIDVYEDNSEYIIAAYTDEKTGEDVQIKITLGGTERTIIIEDIEEIYRG